jgi:restriction system protein
MQLGTSSPSSRAFQEGQVDRRAWEAWFDSQSGDFRAGAEYWAAHRSLRNPGSCTASPPSTNASWTAGCLAAQEKLTPSDTRRKTEPEYRLGWNNPGPFTSLPATTENAGTPRAQNEVGVPGATEVQSTSSASQSSAPSPTASSVPIPAASQPIENNAPAPSQSSASGWIIAVIALVVLGGGWVVWRYRKALKIAGTEINLHANTLHVKRVQTVLPDHYGTIFFDKWQKEKSYFIQTRIFPALHERRLDATYGLLAKKIDRMIEDAAQRPITPSLEVASQFISNPEVFDPRMDPIDYEKHCALQVERAGWSTHLTAATGDQGADVIAQRTGKVLVLQCKLYGSPVGNDAVQQVIAARQYQSADLAAVVSNQTFTRSAKQLAGVSGVHLLHHEQLASFTG